MGAQARAAHSDGKDLYLVRWKGYSEPSWEPDENIGSELAALKRAARERAGADGEGKKRKKGEEKQKKDTGWSTDGCWWRLGWRWVEEGRHRVEIREKKKDKKKRKRGSSDGKKRRDSSDSEREEMGLPPGMPPGFGKGFPKGGFKGPPPFGFPGARPAAEMQRFASDRKHKLRDFVGGLHDFVGKDLQRFSSDKTAKAKELVEMLRLKLEKNALPMFAPMELLLTDALCLLWLLDSAASDEDYEVLLELCKITSKGQTAARHLFADCMQEGVGLSLTSSWWWYPMWMAIEVKPSGKKAAQQALPGLPNASPEHWRDLIVQLYKDHNPNKANSSGAAAGGGGGHGHRSTPPRRPQVGDIDGLMAKYKGRERQLYLCICEKYRVSPNLETKGAAPEDKKVKKYRELITDIYKEHNPSKLSDIDGLLQKYKGREELVYKGICEKYRVEPKASKKEEAKSNFEKYKQLIAEIYEEHNKEKLGELDDLLGKYKGKEKTLYLAVCHKYSIEPKLPTTKKKKDNENDKNDNDDKENREKNSQSEPVDEQASEIENHQRPTANLGWLVDPKDSSKLKQRLPSLLRPLLEVAALHAAGMDPKEAKRLNSWEDAVRDQPWQGPTRSCDASEGSGCRVRPDQLPDQEADGAKGGSRWDAVDEAERPLPRSRAQRRTQRGRATWGGGPPSGDGEDDSLTVAADGPPDARRSFDKAVVHLTDALGRGVRECMELDDEAGDQWYLPWSCEENEYILQTEAERLVKKEVGVEYRRGCWTPRRYIPMHSHSAHHSLCGPDVQRLPDFWRELADKLWLGVLTLNWGTDVPLETVVIIKTTSGYEASPACPGMPQGCRAVPPSASVIVTAATADELETCNRKLGPLLNRALAGLRANAAFAMHTLSMPQLQSRKATWYPGMVLAAREGAKKRDVASSDSDAPDEDFDPDAEVLSDAEATDAYRPLRLTRMKIRHSNEDVRRSLPAGPVVFELRLQRASAPRLPLPKEGNHSGNDCTLRCRFSGERNELPILETVKKVCRRVTDWKKSKSFQEQRNVLALLEQLMIKLEGFADIDLAKHNKEVQDLVKQLNEHTTLFPVEMQDVALSILDMKPPSKQPTELPVPPPPSTPAPKPYVAPKLPKDPPPPMPENKYPWQEKIFLDSILPKGLYGSNVLSRVIGRGGMHHRRMESESGARVFFRGLGVSGRDMELTDSTDCRLHISVKGEVPQQGKSVRRIIKEIVAELDTEVEKGDAGPALDNPRMPDTHPFGFMLPRFTGPESGDPLKFRFPEEDGQTLNDMLLWLKQAKLPIELDTDTQWRTTLQVTPAEPPLPDDAPEQAEIVVRSLATEPWPLGQPDDHGRRRFRRTAAGAGRAAERTRGAPLRHGARQNADVQRIVIEVLKRLRGVVRRQVEDEQLLMYLLYPWAWFSESNRQLKLPYGREKVHEMLADLGRLGGKPTESQVAPPFRGFYVEWLPLKAHYEEEPMPEVAPAPAPAMPKVSSAPRGFCKYWLPEQAFSSRQDRKDLRELITGPGGSHFAHVLRKYPTVDLRIEGQSTLSVPPAHRLHVSMSSAWGSTGSAVGCLGSGRRRFRSLRERFCGRPGLGTDRVRHDRRRTPNGRGVPYAVMATPEQLDALIAQIRTEKYFEAHGIRTPLPSARVVKEEAEFEFVDDEMASDAMSDVTEADGPVPKTVFDDI
eukprot:Skav206407  [mRNA]  locus=scaffold2210:163632:183175:+ [translate_table: standard]